VNELMKKIVTLEKKNGLFLIEKDIY